MKPISRMSWLAVATLPVMLLGACATERVPQMNTVNMSGDDFNRNLARNYKDFANFEAYEMYDWTDAVLYADKAMAANAGKPPAPDDLSTRNIKGAEVAELRTGRARLVQALANGAAQRTPVNAARAQADFDCWAEQQEEGWQFEHIAACKDAFNRSMLATETAMAPAPVPAPVAQAAPAAAGPGPRPYLVYFDWDKSEIKPEGYTVLDQVAQRIRTTGFNVYLVGHADTSGPNDYNMALSERRAEAVKEYLLAKGIGPSTISTKWVGENDPLIATLDDVREAKNRWVAIDVQSKVAGR
ncbi:MAG: OmpA family protein [Rhodospirillales bacterium]|nr:OmpA family protein [Rhodospirillales bacterium]